MRRALVAGALVALALAAVAVAQDAVVPKFEKFKVTPTTVCRHRSDTCQHPGGTIRFKISEYAEVRAATRPLGPTLGPIILFKKNFTAGWHQRHFSAKKLYPGQWDMQLTAIDTTNNASHPVDKTYHVVK
ncbi:MAG: hypothetical protein JOZ25_03390 [Actinobacteria bacterium]|nr:hypothetical protein [Actinomycetota bacterium]